mgnify:CR=1 FL=1
MVFSKEVTKENFYKVYLSIINGLLHLTNKEIQVLSELLRLHELDARTKPGLTAEERSRLLFSFESRNILQKRLGITQFNLNNYMKSLRTKRVIIVENDLYRINPMLIPTKNGKLTKIEFKLVETGELTNN